MSPELRKQVTQLRANIQAINDATGPDVRDRIIAELRQQLKDTQDELYEVAPWQASASEVAWTAREPEDDNGDYARGLRW